MFIRYLGFMGVDAVGNLCDTAFVSTASSKYLLSLFVHDAKSPFDGKSGTSSLAKFPLMAVRR